MKINLANLTNSPLLIFKFKVVHIRTKPYFFMDIHMLILTST